MSLGFASRPGPIGRVPGTGLGRALRAAAGFALMLAAPQVARAHDPPRGLALKWSSSASDALPVIVANRGLVFADRRAGAIAFSLRCAEGFGASVADAPGVFFGERESLLLSIYSGTSSTSDRGCTSQASTGLVGGSFGVAVQDVAVPERLYVTSRILQGLAAVFVSEDDGRSWATRFTNRADEYYDALLVAPSDALRLYASGRRLDRANAKTLHLASRSLDAGKSWQDEAFASQLTLFAVHPRLADVVFAYEANDPFEATFTVLRSDDAGVRFTPVLEGVPQPVALSAGASATSLWLGASGAGGQGGLYRSDDDGLHFERAHADTVQQASCLQRRGRRLWMCANMAPNTAGVWFSEDDGASFEPFMTFADVTEPVPCDGEAQALCARAWLDFDVELHPKPADAAAGSSAISNAGAAGAAVLAGSEPVAEDGGCGVSARVTSHAGTLWWLLLGWVVARRQQRCTTRACSGLARD